MSDMPKDVKEAFKALDAAIFTYASEQLRIDAMEAVGEDTAADEATQNKLLFGIICVAHQIRERSIREAEEAAK